MTKQHLNLAFGVVLITLLSGCASTRLVGTWSEPSYNQKISKILVLGMSKNQTTKRSYESTLASTLRNAGVDAVPAGSIMPSDGDASAEPSKESIKAAIEGKGFDTVLMTRLVSKSEETRYVPGTPYYPMPSPYYHGMYDYYANVYPAVYSPGYLVNDTIVNLETNIYEVKDGKLVWAVISESFNPDDINKEIQSLSDVLVKQLKKDGLLK